MSRLYKLTVFEPSGEKLLDESFTAEDDEKAKELGQNLLNEKTIKIIHIAVHHLQARYCCFIAD